MVDIELRQLEYFVAVAEHLHFGRAAESLSIGQPAVSQQIARLERTLGAELFDRTPRTVRLTEPGTRFLPRARAVLAAVERARESVATVGTPAPLHLGTCSGMGDRLGAILRHLGQRDPKTSVELASVPSRSRLERVAAGQLDAAFVRGVTSAPGVELIEVWQDELVAALPRDHELARLESVPIEHLSALPLRLVSRSRNPVLVDLVLGRCAEQGQEPRLLPYDDGPIDTVLAAVAAGAPSWTVVYASHARVIQSPGVAFRPTEPPLSVPTSLAFPAEARSGQLAGLIDACVAAAALTPHRE